MSSHRLEISSPEARLHADSGEVILLRGAVGSGKSLWLQRLAGLVEPPSKMEITINGVACSTSAKPQPVRMLFDRWPPLWLAQFVGEELAFGLPVRPTASNLTAILEKWGLGELALEADLQTLNRSQAIRLSLAAMELSNPALVLLDNPTAALPQHDANALCNDINEWAKQSDIIVVVACNRWQDWDSAATQLWCVSAPDALPQAQES